MTLASRVRAFMAADRNAAPAKGELGATGTSVFAGLLYEDDYNADLQGDRLYKTIDRMRRSDGQVKAGLLACKLPLMVARWDVEPASEGEADIEIAETVKADLIDGMSVPWDDFLRQGLLMLDFGHMCFEKVWELRDGRWTWKRLSPRLPQSITEWHVTPDGDLDYIVQQASIGNEFRTINIPAEKLVVFTHEKEGSNFRGISLLRAAYLNHWYKTHLYAIDGIAAERHGVGLAVMSYPDAATEAQKTAIKQVGERLHAHERSYIALPSTVNFSLQGVQGQLHNTLASIDHHDLQIVRSILAQFMNLGAKSVGSFALSQDQSSFFLMALQAVGKNICNTINQQVIREMVGYNWDVKQYPRLTVSGLDNPDALAYASSIAQLVTAGAITPDLETENEIRRMAKLPQRKAPPATVVPKPAEAPTNKEETAGPAAASEVASEFWRAPTGVEKSVAFSDIKRNLDSFEDRFVKAVAPIQKRQSKALVNVMAGYVEDKEFARMAEIDVPYRSQVADAIEGLLSELMDYGAEQVRNEATKQGAAIKAKDVEPPDREAFIRIRALAIANILANKMRAALAWEALRQLRGGQLDKGQLTAVIADLSDRDLRTMSRLSAGEAFNLGRQEQAQGMGIKNITSSAIMDSNTCWFCKDTDRKSWKPGEETTNEPPYADCAGRDACRCVWIYTFTGEV